MSFLDQIKAKKSNLNPTETRVTSPSGRVIIERDSQVIYCGENSAGFVIDPNPDLQVAQVSQNLFMGSQDPACDEELLKKHNIRNILSLGVETPKFNGIKYYVLPILDLPEFDITHYIEKAFFIIDSARNSNEPIYVHCNAGVSRSSALVIAYLMRVNSWTFCQAYCYLKEIRPCIKPNEGFIKQLNKKM